MKKAYEFGQSWLELDRNNLKYNIRVLKNFLPENCRLMPVIDMNIYGHAAIPIAKELNSQRIMSFCVPSVSEGVLLREAGINGEILISGYTHPPDFQLLLQYSLTQTVFDCEYAELLNSFRGEIKVHILADAGAHTAGVPAADTDTFLSILKMEYIWVTGLCTYIHDGGDINGEHTYDSEKQFSNFERLTDRLLLEGHVLKTHVFDICALPVSPGTEGYYVRIGTALCGVLKTRESECPFELKPVISIKARIAAVKTIQEGEPIWCRGKKGNRKIAVIFFGYASGLPQEAFGQGRVLIRGEEAPVTGYIRAEQMLVDITDIPRISRGEVVTIVGSDDGSEITMYDLAELAGTNTCVMMSRLKSHINTVVVKN